MSKTTGPVCCICGKPLTKEESIKRGMGDVCAGKYGLFQEHIKDKGSSIEPQSSYAYHVIEIKGEKVGVVIDLDRSGYMSVTNNIDRVCDEIGVKSVIYRDSEGIWDFWSKRTGFKSLANHGAPTTNMDTAIEIAKIRCFNSLGGLFNKEG